MPSTDPLRSNFAFLREHDEQLFKIGLLAERYFTEDPNTCLLKIRQLAELLAQTTASHVGLYLGEESQYDLLSRLRDQGILPREIHQLFGEVRRTGNAANHQISGDHPTALAMLKIAWQISVWFHRTFKAPKFQSGPFAPPKPPKDESAELKAEFDRLSQILTEQRALQETQAQELLVLSTQLRSAQDEGAVWEQLAAEVEAQKAELQQRLAANQALSLAQPPAAVAALVGAAANAAQHVQLDEAETRRLIDDQLRQAGWAVDSQTLRFANGARPENGKNLAIAEWPTETGPADYVLFSGLLPLAAVEAKRQNINVSGSLEQAKRYSRGFQTSAGLHTHPQAWGTQGEFHLPFVYSANGRPWLRQLTTHSGIWFCDLRRPENLSTALQAWHSPEGLGALLEQDVVAGQAQLAVEPFNYGFPLREYQKLAILATEEAIARGDRSMLLAMATGTGKTKTCIALIYRLLKTKRFRRVLFLVDRSALGEQAANAFKDTQMESVQKFADVFGIKELDEQAPDADTAVHLATVQGMVQRVLNPSESTTPPTIDRYDCIIVDECHRGYLLDREMSETEMSFRGFDDYVSKYRRVIDYFDAVKIGLTATPALHTTEIFGPPIFTYGYREAVIDGFLIDHEPPVQIRTELSESGITWAAGSNVPIYQAGAAQLELFRTPDELKFEIDEFNRKVITESFNRVVCNYLATEIDPNSQRKTLVFCANDAHCDLVVTLLKQAFQQAYGSVEDDAVLKITGAADRPLQLIRRYKNERNPSVAVTVDLLTTGVDVPAICNLVFLRRVNSRILFDQMLGRATRRCDEIAKETFRIFDAVRIYEALQNLTAMRPVVVDPAIPFSQLQQELVRATTEEAAQVIRDQFAVKLQRKKRHLSDTARQDFEAAAGMPVDAFLQALRGLSFTAVASWFTQHPGLGEILDRRSDRPPQPVFVSDHEDTMRGAEHGYGGGKKPADYLKEFDEFILARANDLPALTAVLTRPRELTRQQLREVIRALDAAGFPETHLATAYREATNQDIAARIIGYIRRAALGDALLPWDQRVDQALQKILAAQAWTTPQRDWLKKIAAQTKTNLLVDRAAMEDRTLGIWRDGGGFPRLNKVFGGQLEQVLGQFNEAVWQQSA